MIQLPECLCYVVEGMFIEKQKRKVTVMKNVFKPSNKVNILHILCMIATTLAIAIVFRKFLGETFVPLRNLNATMVATVAYTVTVFMCRYLRKSSLCYFYQAVLAGGVGLAVMESQYEYRLVAMGSFIVFMLHNLCVDRILLRLNKIDERLLATRIAVCIILSMFSIGGYTYGVTHYPPHSVEIEEKVPEEKSVPKATPVNLPVAKPITVITKVTEFFMGIYQNAREFEKVVKGREICGYPSEWVDQLKAFENSPLHNGEVTESTVHKDKLRSDILEVGYGTTPGEIADAKRYGFLKKDAEFPKSMTKDEADRWMEEVTIPTYDAMVRDMVKVDLTLQQRFALLSFCHNTGGGNLEKLACYKNRLNSGNLECAPKLIRLYVNAGSHKNVSGLIKRRNWEANLFEESLGEVASN